MALARTRTRSQFLAPWLLLLGGLLTRLTALDHPPSVIFDEVYFGPFASHYCCDHRDFFDNHPPHGKLLIAGVAHALGYRGELAFGSIGEAYRGPVWPLRIATATAGALLPLLVYALLRLLGAGVAAAFSAGFALLLENALLVQSRQVSMDAPMLLAMFAALALTLRARRLSSPGAARWHALGAGLLLGFAVGSKWLALAIVVPMALAIDWRARRAALIQSAIIGGAALAVYVAGWALHFQLLSGPPVGAVVPRTGAGFWADFGNMQRQLLAANSVLQATHPFGSHWYQWPFMQRPMAYWEGAGAARIDLIGNPLVWWGSSFLLLVIATTGLHWRRLTLPLAGYLAAFLPFAGIARVMFMYHYLAALLFAVITAALWLDHVGWIHGDSLRGQRRSYYLVGAALLLAFLLVAPRSYGMAVSADWYAATMRGLGL